MNPILEGWSAPTRPEKARPHGGAVTRLRLVGEITAETAIELFVAIRAEHANSITISIDSGGGNALAALGIFELLTLHPHCIVADIKRASSGAVLAAMGADFRRIVPDGRMMLHEARADLKDAPAAVLRSTLADLELFDGMAVAIIAAATGQPLDRVTSWRRSTTTFSPHQAVAAGLAHEVM